MFDREAFLRPIAHRGLHDAKRGVIENSGPAFSAALAKGYGIECDLRPAADGTPMVFHDRELDRLVNARGAVGDRTPAELQRLAYKRSAAPATIMTLADLIDLAGGRVPLLVEIKSEWDPPDARFMKAIVSQVRRYKGPLALMSFDPAVMVAIRSLAPKIPRGIVSGLYQGDGWWLDKLDETRAYRLSHLIESGPVAPDFFAYHVKALPTAVTQFLREGLNIPLFTWTVRTKQDAQTAARHADAPIFEGIAY